MNDTPLVKTLPLQLDLNESDERKLRDACYEARLVYNRTMENAQNGVDWGDIHNHIDSELVKNTQQRVVAKALGAMENYYDYEDFGKPEYPKDGMYPLRMNFREGYNLTHDEELGDIRFRISTKPYYPVKGVVSGDPAHLDILRAALTSDEWKITTAEALFRGGRPELHVNVTHQEQRVQSPGNSRTVIGLDVNEDNIALAALSEGDVLDSVVIEFPEIKRVRHDYFVKRKRIQNAGKPSFDTLFEHKERRFVHDTVHKLSRTVVQFASRFERPAIAVEDLNGMRENIDYGTRMNRRLHSIPFRALQVFVSYKAAFEGLPTVSIEPAYTSQECALTDCGRAERANRRRHRFKCRGCGHQDHADRNAAVNIAKKGLKKCGLHVPSLKRLPSVRKMRRKASGSVNLPTSTHRQGHQAHEAMDVLEESEGSLGA